MQYADDWVDVFCSVCHRPIEDDEWRDEVEYGTICLDCHNRIDLAEDSPANRRQHTRHFRTILPD